MANKPRIENAEFLILKQELSKRFTELLYTLPKFSRNEHFRQTVQRFRPCVQPNEALGESRLPFNSDGPQSHKRSKDACVLCKLVWTIKLFWLFCGTEQITIGVKTGVYLNDLENYAEFGPKQFKIVGEKYPGYTLEKV